MSTAVKSFTIEHTNEAQQVDKLGMRLMQRRAFEKRNKKNILIKSPPASGKSRALMFIALDKMYRQGLKKTIVAVPEKSIGASFSNTNLTDYGFFRDWAILDKYNLCLDINELDGVKSKLDAFTNFMRDDEARVMLCTHSALRTAFENMDPADFEHCLMAIDEFHHISVSQENKLGRVVTALLKNENTHVLAMTGSYFRGDENALLRPEHEELFHPVVFTYYEQLQGYKYLKTLQIGHHFYPPMKGNDVNAYLAGIRELYKHNEKTIIHIPHANSKESADKLAEYDAISDVIGDFVHYEEDTGFAILRCHQTGQHKVVVNLVEEGRRRDLVMSSLRNKALLDRVDVIVALQMAKEGFDWPHAQTAITVGARGSLTELIQIIGRVTRDHPGKTVSRFINLIAEPLADQALVETAVNDILKAISASLLMEQVISPKFNFHDGSAERDKGPAFNAFSIKIEGFKPPKSERVKAILDQDLDKLKVDVLNEVMRDPARFVLSEHASALLSQALLPQIIAKRYSRGTEPFSDDEAEELRQHLILQMNIPTIVEKAETLKREQDAKAGAGEAKPDGEKPEDKPADMPPAQKPGDDKKSRQIDNIIKAAKKLDVGKLTVNLIESVNPFIDAYSVIARSITPELLLQVQNHIRLHRSAMTLEDAQALFPRFKQFVQENNGIKPRIDSDSDFERELAEAYLVLGKEFARQQAMKKAQEATS